ncbi:MAG: hypothetical protein SGILL_010024 [Bacillariaceae sp.]
METIEEEEEEKERLQKIQQERQEGKRDDVDRTSASALSPSGKKARRESKKKSKKKSKQSRNEEANDPVPSETANEESDTFDSSPADITRQLRQMGLVIRFFGESNDERVQRLQTAKENKAKALEGLSELEEFRLGKGHGIRNPFLEREKESSQLQQHNSLSKDDKDPADGKDVSETVAKADVDEDDQSDPPKYIYKYLKGLLKEWELDLAQRPESVAKSVAGKNETMTLKQCKDYIRPLFKLLKSRKLEDGLQYNLVKIVNFAKQGEFVKAHDAYMDVAIGRAAWPIGVTMVGIHARSGRAKIESSNVAHVMNSELQRKYLTSVKRLLTYAQKKRTDVDPSKKVA